MVQRIIDFAPSDLGREGLTFQGHRFVSEGDVIVNPKTGDRLMIPYPAYPDYQGLYAPSFRFKSATDIGKSMMWCWAWDNMDAALDPSVRFYAYEIGLENGKLKLLRQTELPNTVGIGAGLNRISNGVAIFSALEKVVTFNLRSWKETATWKGELYESGSGKLYMQTPKGVIFQWNPKGRKWEQKSGELPGMWKVLSIGQEEVFAFTDSLYNPKTKASYHYPAPLGNYQILARPIGDPRFGIGLVWEYKTLSPEYGAGVLLNTSTLKPRCTLRFKSAKTWRP